MAGRTTRTGPLLVVLDTNVVLSALVFRSGPAAALRTTWQTGGCIPLVSSMTAAGLIRVLAYPKLRLGDAERDELLADHLPWCRTVRIPRRLPALPPCRDPNDQMFLLLAAVGKADRLVTVDRDLLSMAARFGRPIVSVATMLDEIATP